jgi:hypothetical protein
MVREGSTDTAGDVYPSDGLIILEAQRFVN